uniref:Biogenesis of lysosome-related organelles complex 1 subunit 2 n=1 Tax=Trichuris muris TaxID=70415 RepID=A0A5S6R1V2_TRIMR
MQSQESFESDSIPSTSNVVKAETRKVTGDLAESLVQKSTDYLKEQFEGAIADYKLIERMNLATANRYAQMRETVANVCVTLETLNNLEDGLKPCIESIKELYEIAVRLEQAACTLDNYVKELHARVKLMQKV